PTEAAESPGPAAFFCTVPAFCTDPAAASAPGSIFTGALKFTVLGGRQVRSLHVWYLTSIRTALVPGGTLAAALIVISKVTLFSKKRVSRLKFGSNSTAGCGSLTLPLSVKGWPSGTMIQVGIGPPSIGSIEYKCQ